MNCSIIIFTICSSLFALFLVISFYIVFYYKTESGQTLIRNQLMDTINDTIKEINLRYHTDLFYLFTLESTISNISVFPLNPENISITFINNTNINITILYF